MDTDQRIAKFLISTAKLQEELNEDIIVAIHTDAELRFQAAASYFYIKFCLLCLDISSLLLPGHGHASTCVTLCIPVGSVVMAQKEYESQYNFPHFPVSLLVYQI